MLPTGSNALRVYTCIRLHTCAGALPSCTTIDPTTGQKRCVAYMFNITYSTWAHLGMPIMYMQGTGKWGSFCADPGMNESDATVICRELGYGFGRMAAMDRWIMRDYYKYYNTSVLPIAYNLKGCTGQEKSPFYCSYFRSPLSYPSALCPSGNPTAVDCGER